MWKVTTIVLLVLVVVSLFVLYYFYDRARMYDSLKTEYDTLNHTYSVLSQNYTSLEGQYSTTNAQLTSLRDAYNTLQTQYNDLQTQHNAWYDTLRTRINLRQGLDQDKMKFITPDDPLVRSLVVNITGGWSETANWNEYWGDSWLMYTHVTYNIHENHDSLLPLMPTMYGALEWRQEFWNFPNETIEFGYGDSEDKAVLLASMILNYGSKNYTEWIIEWTSDSGPHYAVAFPVTGGQLTIMDPTVDFHTVGSNGRLGAKDINEAVTEFVSFLGGKGEKNVKIDLVFSTKVYKTFVNTDGFIQWASNQ